MGASMSGHLKHKKTVRLLTNLSLGVVLLLFTPLAVAQNNVGDLLDAGAKMISTEEFKQEVVQRTLVGPTASGGSIEVMYTSNGSIAGLGTLIQGPGTPLGRWPVGGEWSIGDRGRICTSMRVAGLAGPVTLPPRCQAWFKYQDEYFIADSDSDRRARVLRRTVKP